MAIVVPWLDLLRRNYPGTVAILMCLLAAGIGNMAGSRMNPIDGFFFDSSLAMTSRRPGASENPVAVIALDRSSLAADELSSLPRAFLAPIWAKVTDGLIASGARAIGFDIIFEYSANRFPGFQGQYDRDFLLALARAHERLVLARSAQAIPAAPFVAAALDGGADIELVPDPDGVHRHLTGTIRTADGQLVPSFAAAVLARAGATPMPVEVLLGPERPLEATPTYRVIDVLRCLEQDPAALREAFAGKIVLIGTNLPEEDRKRTPDRFMPAAAPRTSAASSCVLGRLGASDPGSGTSPGVMVHAAAIEAVQNGNLIRPLNPIGRAAAAVVASLAGTMLGLLLRPWLAAIGLAALGAVGFATAVVLLGFGWWLALAVPLGAAIVSMVAAYLVRFLVEERRRRRVQNAFNHYLAPAIVDQLAESEAELHLGGELRDVTVMFADLSGFTALSGKVGPSELMSLTNAYLGIIVEAVEASGGYVDKFIGDAVMGVWGAPVPNPDHAAAAGRAALRAVDGVMRAKAAADAHGEHGYSVKIGLNSGPAVVGNVGAPKRYNYTAVGETVNIAARLESVPGDYGCRIVVGPRTASLIADRFVLCELDWVKVKGKEEAIAVYELIGDKADAASAELAYPVQYRAALDHYRAGDFASAEECWHRRVKHPFLAGAGASPPRVMAERCAELRAAPPTSWDGVFVKTTK